MHTVCQSKEFAQHKIHPLSPTPKHKLSSCPFNTFKILIEKKKINQKDSKSTELLAKLCSSMPHSTQDCVSGDNF